MTKLNIRPFSYGLAIDGIFDNGSYYPVAVLDIDESYLAGKFSFACQRVAAVSLATNYPTQASLPHSISNAFKSLVAITVNLENFSFPKADPYKAFLKDPSAFASAAPAAAAPAAGAAPAAKVEEKKKEEEVDALDGGMDMFGGGGAKTGDY